MIRIWDIIYLFWPYNKLSKLLGCHCPFTFPSYKFHYKACRYEESVKFGLWCFFSVSTLIQLAYQFFVFCNKIVTKTTTFFGKYFRKFNIQKDHTCLLSSYDALDVIFLYYHTFTFIMFSKILSLNEIISSNVTKPLEYVFHHLKLLRIQKI